MGWRRGPPVPAAGSERIGAVEWVDARRTREPGWEHLVGAPAGEATERTCELRPVDRVVDRFLERDLPRPVERRPVVVEGDEPRPEGGSDEEPSAWPVEAVLLGQRPIRGAGSSRLAAEVGAVVLDRLEACLEGRAGRPDDPVDVRGAVAAVERVALEHGPLVGDPLGEVVRPGPGRVVDLGRGCVREDRAEEGHRQPGREVSGRLHEPDSQPVRPEDADPGNAVGRAVDHGAGALNHAHIWRCRGPKPGLGGSVERVREALRTHRRAGVEAEGPLELEGVRPTVPRGGVRPNDLRNRPCARGARLVRMVEELRARGVLEQPRVRCISECGIDVIELVGGHDANGPTLRCIGGRAEARPGAASPAATSSATPEASIATARESAPRHGFLHSAVMLEVDDWVVDEAADASRDERAVLDVHERCPGRVGAHQRRCRGRPRPADALHR